MILAAGIDTLCIGFYLKEFILNEQDWNDLMTAKENAKAPVFRSSGHLMNFKGLSIIMRAAGAKPYTYVLQGDDFTIKLAKKVSCDLYPEVFVEFRSQFLRRMGYKHAYNFIKEWVSSWAEIRDDVVSRADLAVDVSGFPDIEIENIVTRARSGKEYFNTIPIQQGEYYYYGKKQTGYVFGCNPLTLRIYNKTLEIKKSRKEWFYEIWRNNGWDGEQQVARIEMELQRAFLKDFNVTNFKSFEEATADMFRFITNDWFSVRTPSKDKNKSRWPVAMFWIEIKDAINHFGKVYGQIRGQIKTVKEKVLIPQIAGLITSYGALKDNFAIGDMYYEVNEHIRKKGLTLNGEIDEKKKMYAVFEDCFDPF